MPAADNTWGRRAGVRSAAGAAGIALVAIGVAERLGFFSFEALITVVAGFSLIAVAGLWRGAPPGPDDPAYPIVFTALAVVAAITVFLPGGTDPILVALILGAVVAFHALSVAPGTRRFRLPVAAALLIAAHAVIIVRVPFPPHQDVFRFLNFGVDALVRGHNPYGSVVGADGSPFRLTYPPGALLLLAPFRLVFQDVRWGYVAAEAAATLLVMALLAQRSRRARLLGARPGDEPTGTHARRPGLTRWEDALILLPLALPRVSEAFFIFSNHEWVLLALAAAALYLRGSWLWAGLVLGVGLASKQYFVVFPVLFLAPHLRPRSLALGGAVAVAICLPFIAWGAADFLDKVFGNLGAAPDPTRLTLWAAAYHLGMGVGRSASVALFGVGAAAVGALAWWAWGRPVNVALLACGLALAVFTLCASFAAYNYYAYALVFCTWGLLLPSDWERRGARGSRPRGTAAPLQ